MAETQRLEKNSKPTLKQLIEDELRQIADNSGGILRAEDVVQFARSRPESALHTQFTWSVQKAAYQHWIDQARRVIRLHVQVIQGRVEPVRTFVSIKEDRLQQGGGYRYTIDVLKHPERRAILVHQALSEAAAWQRKYKNLEELSTIFAAIDAAQEKSQRKTG